MADDLIPILSRAVGEESHGVDARTLHATLGNRDHFSTWIGDRIAQLGLVQSIDWESFSESSEKGGRPRIEYILTLDAAKHVAMVEKTAKGAELRAYFIAAEERRRVLKEARELHDATASLITQLEGEESRERALTKPRCAGGIS